MKIAWLKKPHTEKIISLLTRGKGEMKFIGGCVRHSLLHLPINDVDIATNLEPEEVIKRCKRMGVRAIPTGIEHGTVTAISDGIPFEITTLRQDVETYGRHALVCYTNDWMEDAMRRDLTINTTYMNPDGALFDPFDGLKDLQKGIIRFVGDPGRRILEDHLRIMRFFRFYADYGKGKLDAKGFKACKKYANLIPTLSGERIRIELFRILKSKRATKALRAMKDARVLRYVIPKYKSRFSEMDALAKLETDADPVRRLFLLITKTEQVTHLKLSRADKKRISMLFKNVRLPIKKEMDLKVLIYMRGADAARDVVCIQGALKKMTPAKAQKHLKFIKTWRVPTFPIKGKDLIAKGTPKGPTIGRKLKSLEKKWIAGGFR